jgi:hypothetical protein
VSEEVGTSDFPLFPLFREESNGERSKSFKITKRAWNEFVRIKSQKGG